KDIDTPQWLRGPGRQTYGHPTAREQGGRSAELVALVAAQSLQRAEAEEPLGRDGTPTVPAIDPGRRRDGSELIASAAQSPQTLIPEVAEPRLAAEAKHQASSHPERTRPERVPGRSLHRHLVARFDS